MYAFLTRNQLKRPIRSKPVILYESLSN